MRSGPTSAIPRCASRSSARPASVWSATRGSPATSAHFNGRNGLGAVMGSKHLKAIAVRGGARLTVHDAAARQGDRRSGRAALPRALAQQHPARPGHGARSRDEQRRRRARDRQLAVGDVRSRRPHRRRGPQRALPREARRVLRVSGQLQAGGRRRRREHQGRPPLRRTGVRDPGGLRLQLRGGRLRGHRQGERAVQHVRRRHDLGGHDDLVRHGLLRGRSHRPRRHRRSRAALRRRRCRPRPHRADRAPRGLRRSAGRGLRPRRRRHRPRRGGARGRRQGAGDPDARCPGQDRPRAAVRAVAERRRPLVRAARSLVRHGGELGGRRRRVPWDRGAGRSARPRPGEGGPRLADQPAQQPLRLPRRVHLRRLRAEHDGRDDVRRPRGRGHGLGRRAAGAAAGRRAGARDVARCTTCARGSDPQDDVLPPLFLTPIPDGPLAGRHAIDPDAVRRRGAPLLRHGRPGTRRPACRRPAGWPSSAWRSCSTPRSERFSRHGRAQAARDEAGGGMGRAPARASRPGPAPVVAPAPTRRGSPPAPGSVRAAATSSFPRPASSP